MRERAKRVVMLALWTSINGCEGENPAVRVPVRTVDYAGEIQALLDKRCVRCHRSSLPRHGYLNLKADSSHHQLLTRRSVQRPELRIVEPYSPDASYLVWKLENDPRIEGYRMPMLSLPMPEEETLLVRTWILEGALPQ